MSNTFFQKLIGLCKRLSSRELFSWWRKENVRQSFWKQNFLITYHCISQEKISKSFCIRIFWIIYCLCSIEDVVSCPFFYRFHSLGGKSIVPSFLFFIVCKSILLIVLMKIFFCQTKGYKSHHFFIDNNIINTIVKSMDFLSYG